MEQETDRRMDQKVNVCISGWREREQGRGGGDGWKEGMGGLGLLGGLMDE